MSSSQISLSAEPAIRQATGWRELWRSEDWWAVWLGLALVLSAYFLFASGSGLPKWIAVTPAKWSHWPQVAQDYRTNRVRESALPMSGPWCAGWAAPCRSHRNLIKEAPSP